ncbi:hypothetical protein [Enterococcus sp. 2201sp1_2201st1_C11_2201SCRN_220225]|uniref:hypothetical protein n=2 Tax=unclassified Enterococcus TaxID=2608891 RepID=UPI0034A2A5CA
MKQMKNSKLISTVVAVLGVVLVGVGFYNLHSYINAEAAVDQKFVANLLIDNSEYENLTKEKIVELTKAEEVGEVLDVEIPDDSFLDSLKPGIYSAKINLQLPYNQKIQRIVAVNVRDTVSPVIESDETIKLTQGEDFPLDKVTVTDQAPKTLDSEALKVSGFDKEKVGEQKVQLTATDLSGNQTTKEVTVQVAAKPEKQTTASTEEATPAETQAETAEAIVEPITEEKSEEGSTEAESTAATEVPNSATSATNNASDQGKTQISEATPAPTTPAPVETSVLRFAGSTVPFIPSGGASAAPGSGAGTWMGSGSVTDGAPTHFIGHNPGDFSGVMGLSVGSAITVVDSSGNSRTYTVYEVIDVNDDGYNANNPSDDVFPRMLYAGGERISLQTCINDSVNRCVLAS